MIPPTLRRSRVLPYVAAFSFTSALAMLLLAGPATADPTDPPSPDPSATDTAPSTTPTETTAPTESGTPSPGSPAPSSPPVKRPGKITCEDLGLGTTLQKVNGARKNKVITRNGVSSVVKDTDVDGDGDPDSLFVTVEEGTEVTAIVAFHGNRANIYEESFGTGELGPFYSPPRKRNAHPPVNHRLICGPPATSPSPSETSSETPSGAPSGAPSETMTSPAPGDGGGLPVTGLTLTGLVLTGAGMVGAGMALRALRRRNAAETGDAAESTED